MRSFRFCGHFRMPRSTRVYDANLSILGWLKQQSLPATPAQGEQSSEGARATRSPMPKHRLLERSATQPRTTTWRIRCARPLSPQRSRTAPGLRTCRKAAVHRDPGTTKLHDRLLPIDLHGPIASAHIVYYSKIKKAIRTSIDGSIMHNAESSRKIEANLLQ